MSDALWGFLYSFLDEGTRDVTVMLSKNTSFLGQDLQHAQLLYARRRFSQATRSGTFSEDSLHTQSSENKAYRLNNLINKNVP